MAKMFLTTQLTENYGAHAWDGTGECPQYWKFKGGNDYVVLNVDINQAAAVAAAATRQINQSDDYYQEWVVGWEVVADNALTEYEQMQLDDDGEIIYPAKVITVETAEA